MKKIILQAFITFCLFFATWFAMKQINWIKIFNVKKNIDKTEEKLGKLLWESIQNSEEEIKESLIVSAVDSIVNKICSSNHIERNFIKVHIIKKEEANAFALPDGYLIVYSGLIKQVDKQEELCGVIGHELAHIELNHIMKKLVRELGLSALISITSGSGGGEIIRQTTKTLSSSAFDRSLEKEADLKAVDYLLKAKINPEPFAEFLYRLSDEENEATRYLNWLSTHPDSKERSEYIIQYCRNRKTKFEKVLSEESFSKLKSKL